MKRLILLAAISAVLGLSAANAHAYLFFFGEDLNSNPIVFPNINRPPLTAIPNSSAAEASFLSNLSGVGTETFESFLNLTGPPLVLTFPGVGTATLSGASGQVVSLLFNTSNGGRYSIPSGSSNKYWDVIAGPAGNFVVTFSSAVAAFGFYGTDIGDFVGQLQLSLTPTVGPPIFLPPVSHTTGTLADGAVLFYGFIAQNAGEDVTSVSFVTTTGNNDIFGFDRFTVGTRQQVSSVPEPASLVLLGLGLAGLRATRRWRKA